MRGIIHDQVLHKFIEGPIQSGLLNNSFQKPNDEKTSYYSDSATGYKTEDNVNANISDIDWHYNSMNERLD